MEAIVDWLPDGGTILADMSYVWPLEEEAAFLRRTSWKGMTFRWRVLGREEGGDHWFSCTWWSRQTALHWRIPLVATAIYIVMIPLMRWYVAKRGKFDVKNIAFWWNSFLSVFSFFGVFACVPVLVQSLSEHGLAFTTCAPALWYGSGNCGLFVALFIYSKLAELVDTLLLLLAGKPVIALQWWHHSTVLLYCWHSYAVRIATGLWFAAMNYSVHAIMYGYFALTTTKYRQKVSRYAIYITLLQLLQMLVGMFVTIKAVSHQIRGEECHVNKTNSVLGLGMYASYFVLFMKLFVENYFLNPKRSSTRSNGAKWPEAPHTNGAINGAANGHVNGKEQHEVEEKKFI
jgi:elongation of very long chain fatty acids protein 6